MASCFQCHNVYDDRKPSDTKNRRSGRPLKHAFCGRVCYDKWRAQQHLDTKARWLKFQREVWGSTDCKRFEVSLAKQFGRVAERRAIEVLLPSLGFTEIDDLSGMSNQFFIDFVACYKGERVLVDATFKLKAYIPEKTQLAKALRMPLYIIHVSPANDELYWIHQIPVDRTVCRVPASFIRQNHQRYTGEEGPVIPHR